MEKQKKFDVLSLRFDSAREDEGILICKKYGRICLYRFSKNIKANAVRELLETWEDASM